MQDVRRCRAPDGAEIAYAVSGSGPVLVLPAWWVSDVEADWADPHWRVFFERLGANHTVVRYDRPGAGQSSRERSSFTFDDEIVYLQTVIEALDAAPVSLLAMSCGGPPAIAVASRRPELVSHLVFYGSYLIGPELAPVDTKDALVALVRSTWGSLGSRTLADIFLPSATTEEVAEFARRQREVASPEVAAELLRLTYDMDASDEVSGVRCPVLVLHRTGDRAVHPRCGRALATAIGADRSVELPGTEHSMERGDSVALIREIERFLLGSSTLEYTRRELAAILFTDIVDSTSLATELGDQEWSLRLDEHEQISRTAVDHFDGRVVKATGDGVVATFALPTQALACARKLHRDVHRTGVRVRIGVHVGEIELRGDDIAGIAVNVAARVMSQASAGETHVTSVVRDLSTGSGFDFEPLPTTPLKGVEGEWTRFAVS